MEHRSVESIIRTLNQHQVRYLIAGGLAVVAHGYVRFTADVDVILAIDQENLTLAISALKSLEYRPRAPVPIEDFVNPERRQQWAIEKQMRVFSLFSPKHPATEVDLFLEPPIDFVRGYARKINFEIGEGISGTFCGIEDLIELKTKAGRPQDLADIAKLGEMRSGGTA